MLSRLRRPQAPAEPLSAAAEEEAVRKLRNALDNTVSLDIGTSAWADEKCMRRYLRARKYDHDKALAMLLETIEWRSEESVATLFPVLDAPEYNMLRSKAECGKMFVLPHLDNRGRATIVMKPGLQEKEEPAADLRFLIYTLERATRLASKSDHIEQKFVIIVDYAAGNFSLRTAPSLSTSKATLNILQNHFPERLALALLLDAPSVGVSLFKLVKPFIDPVTATKIHFRTSGNQTDAQRESLAAIADLQCVPREYGGLLDYKFDIDTYFTAS